MRAAAPELLAVYGVGIHTAAELLAAVGDNPDRIGNEAAFAHLCGVAPIPANTGKRTGTYRLNPGGNRHANQALWHIVLTRVAQRSPAPSPTCNGASARASPSATSSAA